MSTCCASQWQAGTVCCRLAGLPLSVSDEGQPRVVALTRAPPREGGEDDRGDEHRERLVTIADPDLETVDTEVGGAENKVGMHVTGILPIVTEAEVIERSEKPDETDAEVTDGPLELRRR